MPGGLQPCPRPGGTPGVPRQPRSPSNLPEKLSVALQRFFFLFLFLASGISMGWLEGMSAPEQSHRRETPPSAPPSPAPQSLRGTTKGQHPGGEDGRSPLGRSPPGGHPQLTRTGRALEVEDGLQVVGLVKLQVEGVLSLQGPRTGVGRQPPDQLPPAAQCRHRVRHVPGPGTRSARPPRRCRTPAHGAAAGGTWQSPGESQRRRRRRKGLSTSPDGDGAAGSCLHASSPRSVRGG